MKIFAKIFLNLSLLCTLHTAKSQTWQPATDFPSTERDDGTSFIIGTKAYCGTGYLPWFTTTADFYAYDMAVGTWQTVASLPAGEERQYASGFSAGGYG